MNSKLADTYGDQQIPERAAVEAAAGIFAAKYGGKDFLDHD
jgi:hypothetical protein